MGTQNYIPNFVGNVSLPDCFRQSMSSFDRNRTPSLLGSKTMQPSLRPSQQEKKALVARTGRTFLGSIRELPDLQAKGRSSKLARKCSYSIHGKLRSRWDGLFVITKVFSYGVVELKDENTNNTFQVNGYHIKLFHEGPTPIVDETGSISLMEPALPDDTP
ncbi:hypothetical protein CR513_32537, partial [Mucuna pruriens]